MKMWIITFLLTLGISLVSSTANNELSCAPRLETCDSNVDYFRSKLEFDYSSSVKSLTYNNTYAVLKQSWTDWSGENTQDIIFVRCGCPKPSGFESYVTIFVPVANAFIEETVSVPKTFLLGQRSKIVAVGSGTYVTTLELIDDISNGMTVDVNGNFSKLLELPTGIPDVLFTGTGPSSWKTGWTEDMNFRRIIDADAGETSPLGRAELMKLAGIVFGVEDVAEAVFELVESRYLNIKKAAAAAKKRPSVMVGVPYFYSGSSSWSAPGQGTYVAQFLEDANVEYKFAEMSSDSLSPTEHLQVFAESQYWINAAYFSFDGSKATMTSLVSGNQTASATGDRGFFKQFRAFKCGNVYGQDNALLPGLLGNPIFEEGILRPDILLADLVEIFHYDVVTLSENRPLYFYQKLASLADNSDIEECKFVNLPTLPAGNGEAYAQARFSVTGLTEFQFLDNVFLGIKSQIASKLKIDESTFELFIANNPAPTDTTFTLEFNAAVGTCNRCSSSVTDSTSCSKVGDLASLLKPKVVQDALASVSSSASVSAIGENLLVCSDANTYSLQEFEDSGLSGGAIAGIVVGSFVALAIVVLVAVFFSYRAGYQIAYKRIGGKMGPRAQALNENDNPTIA